jgi:hypothetical protein
MLYSVDSNFYVVVYWVVGGLIIGWREFERLTHYGRHIGEVVCPYLLEVVHSLAVVSAVKVELLEARYEKNRSKPTALKYNQSL